MKYDELKECLEKLSESYARYKETERNLNLWQEEKQRLIKDLGFFVVNRDYLFKEICAIGDFKAAKDWVIGEAISVAEKYNDLKENENGTE